MGKFIGPGYVRAGPVTAGLFGCGCIIPTVAICATLLLGIILIIA